MTKRSVLFHRRRTLVRWTRALALGAGVVALLPVGASAQASAAPASGNPAIGIVDAGRVFQTSQYGLGLLESLKQLREQKQAEGKAKQDDAQELQTRIAQSRLALSPEKLEELEKELEEKVIELQRFEADAQREIEEASSTAMASFNEQIMPVIDQVGREAGMTLIFNKFEAGLLFADPSLDITEMVIARFDELNAAAAPAAEESEESQ